MEGGCFCKENIIDSNCDFSPHVQNAGNELERAFEMCDQSPYTWCLGNWDCEGQSQCFDMGQGYFFEDETEQCSPDGEGCFCKENVRDR